MITTIEAGSRVEIATIGNEGPGRAPVFLGTHSMPVEVFVQVDGKAATLPASVLRERTGTAGPLLAILQRYTQALLSQIAQAGACNRLHPIDQRCARWVMTHDRV